MIFWRKAAAKRYVQATVLVPPYDGLEDKGFVGPRPVCTKVGQVHAEEIRKPSLGSNPLVVPKELMKLQKFWLQFFLFALILSVFDHRLLESSENRRNQKKSGDWMTMIPSFRSKEQGNFRFFDIDISLVKN